MDSFSEFEANASLRKEMNEKINPVDSRCDLIREEMDGWEKEWLKEMRETE